MKRFIYVLSLTVLAATSLFAGGSGESSASFRLSMGGSTTMESIMTSSMEVYRTEVDPTAELSYDAQGSTMGIQGVLNGIFDLGCSSRALLPQEIQQGVKTTTVAIDGLAVIANERVPLDDLTIEQVAAIFVGEIKNWSAIGGPDAKITVVNRDAASGTRGAFRELVLETTYGDDARFILNALVTESDGNMATMVAQTPYAIGYASMHTLDRVRESGGKDLSIDGIRDTPQTVSNGSYPIIRPLNVITYGDPANNAKTFVDFLLSSRGQQIVQENGFLPVR